jgi:hypothetical protein
MRNYDNRYRAFSEEDEEYEDEETTTETSDYSFEGFDIEVNEKIMLTAVNPTRND